MHEGKLRSADLAEGEGELTLRCGALIGRAEKVRTFVYFFTHNRGSCGNQPRCSLYVVQSSPIRSFSENHSSVRQWTSGAGRCACSLYMRSIFISWRRLGGAWSVREASPAFGYDCFCFPREIERRVQTQETKSQPTRCR